MKFILCTNNYAHNHCLDLLIKNDLRPQLVVTYDPFYTDHKNIFKRLASKTIKRLQYYFAPKNFRKKYNIYFLAKSNNLSVWPSQKINSSIFEQYVKKHKIDFLFTFTFKILASNIINALLQGAINFHPALLPSYKGATPCNWVILDGQKTSGYTFHFIGPKIDEGPIVFQEEYLLSSNETAGSLYKELLTRGAHKLNEIIDKLKNGKSLKIIKTLKRVNSYQKPFRKIHGEIKLGMSSRELDRIVRASNIDDNFAFINVENQTYFIKEIELLNQRQNQSTVLSFDQNKNIQIQTSDHKLIKLKTINT